VVEPGFHIALIKFTGALFTIKIDCIIQATFLADITFHIGELTTLVEHAEHYRANTTVCLWDRYHSQLGGEDMKWNLILLNYSWSDCRALVDR
jgi:hypothetical protein